MPLRLLVLLLLASLPARGQDLAVRVLLEEVSPPLLVSLDEGHHGQVDDGAAFATTLPLDWPVGAQDGFLTVDGAAVGRSLTLEPASGTFAWQGRRYRGALRLVAVDDRLLVINLVGLEEYLRGVVPAEMQASWPMEALKAQAVAARTFTLSSLDPLQPYDVCATIDCQVYEGMSAEHPRSDQAIAETAGLVLTYQGSFARTYYHADSGGVVASSAEVWGYDAPYLAARSDVGTTTPHRRWERRLDPAQVAASLRGMGWEVGTVRALRITAVSESGRALEAEVVGSAGRARLGGTELTALLRAWGLKSTRMSMVGDLTARGDGWGHGVGMSQYGARALALSAHGYDQILAFYYPNTTLQRLAPAEVRPPAPLVGDW